MLAIAAAISKLGGIAADAANRREAGNGYD
jgi:hypothetical protein